MSVKVPLNVPENASREVILRHAKKLTKNAEQRKVLSYFLQDCCILRHFGLKDADYEKLVQSKIESLNLKERAINKIGLDEEEISEIPPVNFIGYWIDDNFVRETESGKYVSSTWMSTWLFFSKTQIYVYEYSFCMCADAKEENTEEYFYKDVTSISTTSESVTPKWFAQKGGCIFSKKGVASRQIDTTKFQIVVPGDKFKVAMDSSEDIERMVQAMKQQLRDKKSN